MSEKSQVILLVEDDDSISEPLIFGLKKEGSGFCTQPTAVEA